jgi:hypothetical protein
MHLVFNIRVRPLGSGSEPVTETRRDTFLTRLARCSHNAFHAGEILQPMQATLAGNLFRVAT